MEQIKHPLDVCCDIAPLILELAKGVQNKPFLLRKTQDASLLLKEVLMSLKSEIEV